MTIPVRVQHAFEAVTVPDCFVVQIGGQQPIRKACLNETPITFQASTIPNRFTVQWRRADESNAMPLRTPFL